MSAALEIRDLAVTYGGAITGVSNISLRVEEGTIVALLGSNGAGKSTVLKAISGILPFEKGRITNGSITALGETVENIAAHRTARRGIAHVREGRRIFSTMTVEENLLTGTFALPRGRKTSDVIEPIYEFFPPLRERRHNAAGYLSGGEQQMLAIGRALASEPKLILVDEASLGLAPMMAEEIFTGLKRINAERAVSVLLVEQNANLALANSSYAYVLETGEMVLEGTAEELAADTTIASRYLGGA